MLQDSLTYPLRGNGWIMILAGAVFFVGINLLHIIPLIGGILAIFTLGYLAAFYLEVVSASMGDSDEPPDWPDFSDFREDLGVPLVRLLLAIALSFGPAIVIDLFADDMGAWHKPALWVAVIGGCLYFPMAVLAMQATGAYVAALPHIVVPAVWRCLPRYLVAVVAGVTAFLVCSLAQDYVGVIPLLGWFLAAAVALYSLMLQGRLIGLIYRDKRDQLGWE